MDSDLPSERGTVRRRLKHGFANLRVMSIDGVFSGSYNAGMSWVHFCEKEI